MINIVNMSTGDYRVMTVDEAFELAKISSEKLYAFLSEDEYSPLARAAIVNKFGFN